LAARIVTATKAFHRGFSFLKRERSKQTADWNGSNSRAARLLNSCETGNDCFLLPHLAAIPCLAEAWTVYSGEENSKPSRITDSGLPSLLLLLFVAFSRRGWRGTFVTKKVACKSKPHF
jgi:hypothetical protein